MNRGRSVLARVVLFVVVVAIAFLVFMNHSFIFSRTVEGRIIGVDRIMQPAAVIGGAQMSPETLFSFAVAIEDGETKKVYTASSEDRQWGVAKHCARARARFYPYPFWNLEKSGTYFNARLIELYDCNQAGATPGAAPAPDAPPAQ